MKYRSRPEKAEKMYILKDITMNSVLGINQPAVKSPEPLPCSKCSRSPGLRRVCDEIATIATATALDVMKYGNDSIDGGPEDPKRYFRNPRVVEAVRRACLQNQVISQ